MSYMKTTSICCDDCGCWSDFGLPQPATTKDLVRRARKMGWSCSIPRRDAVDLCPSCAKSKSGKPDWHWCVRCAAPVPEGEECSNPRCKEGWMA